MAEVHEAAKAYKESVMKKAEQLITSGLSQRINSLRELVNSGSFQDREANFHPPVDVFDCNEELLYLVNNVTVRLEEMIEDCKVLKLWIDYLTPRVEDGNNFGVQVQEAVVDVLLSTIGAAQEYYSFVGYVFENRGKLISKLVKYPQVESYKTAVKQFDRREYFRLRLALQEMLDRYANIHNVIITNLDKIVKPRTDNRETIY